MRKTEHYNSWNLFTEEGMQIVILIFDIDFFFNTFSKISK